MGKTGPQVYSGLAGLFIIDDANSGALSLPKTYGIDDIPLIVQDRNFDAAGHLVYGGTRTHDTFGELGKRFLSTAHTHPMLRSRKAGSGFAC
jgi:FtsP/CotA-like multicopper oxidase with cupredoxin domain